MLTLVPTPIGNIADISIRAMKTLGDADIIFCEDTRVTKQLLTLLETRYALKRKDSQRFLSLHSHNEDAFLHTLKPDFFASNVVYVSDAGMPAISDPGAKLVAYAKRHEIDYDVLPGPNAAVTAYAASGWEHGKFTFYGFLPHKGKEREAALLEVLSSAYDVICYESPHRLLKLFREIATKEPQRNLFLAKELTKKYQTFYSGNALELLSKLEKESIKGEWVVIVEHAKSKTAAGAISIEDIEALEIPKKQKAKLLAKLTGRNIKELYNEML